MKEEELEARALVNGFLMLSFQNYGIDYAKECAKFTVDYQMDQLRSMSSFVNPDIYAQEIERYTKIKEEIDII